MSNQVPTTEPTSVFAGDFITWKKTLADYPASLYALSYRLIGSGAAVTIPSTASGSDHLVAYPGASVVDPPVAGSDVWPAGLYTLTPCVTEIATGNRTTLAAQTLEVKANPLTATATDTRSFARRMLGAIEACILGNASPDQKRMKINSGSIDRELEKIPPGDLLTLRARYKSEVENEEALARGSSPGGRMLVRL